jgi:hypothetical protein
MRDRQPGLDQQADSLDQVLAACDTNWSMEVLWPSASRLA